MLSRHQQFRTQTLRLVDAAIYSFAFWFAHALRAHAGDFGYWLTDFLARFRSEAAILPFDTFLPVFVLIFPIALFTLETVGYYRRGLLATRLRTFWQITQASVVVTIGVILVMFILKSPSARGVVLLFAALAFTLMVVREELYRYWVNVRQSSDALRRRLLLVGAPADTSRLRREFLSRSSHDLHVMQEVDIRSITMEEMLALLHERAPNGVVIATEHADFGQAEKVVRMCELEGVEVWLMADFFKTTIFRTNVDELHGRPMLVFNSGPEFSWRGVFKRAIDVTLSLVSLVVLGPLLLLIGVVIRLTSAGPALYLDKRCGLNGRPFMMYKFRSMIWNADQLKPQLAHRNEMLGPVFKVTNDPRTTRVGAFLRRFSLDELPQLVNVLKGEMSLVGPRPLVVDEIRRFDDVAHRRRLSVKPGLTCLWQVNGRSNMRDFNDWMKMDLQYIDDWSLTLDLKILLRTIPSVLSGNGAK